ncbi:MAG: hypothetical protein COU70_01640 [Parcubacteria group bacterium CG10_big_fil_rev_8_21_14_0_10_35_15]|nr:MAG: hypothetical protein COU70_01640 [Parcubacteria group bacterium CG10_big_fil_rev_8_21_14_0_10_35_15]
MTQKRRTLLFFICLSSFLIVAPTIVLYSQGYRFDLKNRTITKTGAFYVKVSPKNCDILINNKFKSKTDFLFGSDLIENLVPATYLIEIKKEGYIPWQKNLKIKAMMTTEAKNVILFPQNLDFQTKTSGVKKIFPLPSNKKIILEKRDSQGWYLTSFDLKNNLEEVLVLEKDFNKKKLVSSLLDLTLSTDSKKAIVKIALGETEKFFLIDTENKNNPILLDSLGNFEKISFQDNDSSKFFILKNSILYSGNFSTLKTTKLIEKIIDFNSNNNELYLLDSAGFIFKTNDLTRLPIQRLSETPFTIMSELPYEFKIFNQNIFLKQENKLFLFNEKIKEFTEIAKNVNNFIVSQDNNKLAYLNDTEISVYFFKEKLEQIEQSQSNQNILLVRFSEKINQIFWLNNDYLVFTINNKLKAIEIDNRDQPNIVDLAEFNNPQIYFNKENKNALILTEGNLLISDQILP